MPDAPTPTTPAPSGDATADAKATLSQLQQDITAKKWDAAKADLSKLNGMKDKLSPGMQDEIKALSTQLEAAKAANSLKIPGFGGGDNK